MNDNESKLVKVDVVTSAQGTEYPISLDLGTKWFTATSPSGRELGSSTFEDVKRALIKAVGRIDAGKRARVRPEVKLLALAGEALVDVTYRGVDLVQNEVIFEDNKGNRIEYGAIKGFVRGNLREVAARLVEEESRARQAAATASDKVRTIIVPLDLRVRDIRYLDGDNVAAFEARAAQEMQDVKIAL